MMFAKPDLGDIARLYGEVRRRGRGYVFHAPCHEDHNPSGRIDDAKPQFWFCDPCGRGGDVIDFVMLAAGLTFPQALRALGIDSKNQPRPVLTEKRKRSAELAAAWISYQREKFNVLIGDGLKLRDLADEAAAFDLAEIFDRELVMLRGFYAFLKYPRSAMELLAAKESVEAITGEVELVFKQPVLPAVTPEYRARLKALLKDNPLDFSGCFR